MTNPFDDAIIRDGPDIERRAGVKSGKVMIAIDHSDLPIDPDDLALGYMTVDAV